MNVRLWHAVGLATLVAAAGTHAQPTASPSDNAIQARPLYQDLQQALEALSRAEISREEASLNHQKDRKLGIVRRQCRQAISQLRSIDKQLTALLRKTYQQRPSQRDKASWTIRELESLVRHVKVQLARGYRNQALCYGEDSLDRVNSLSIALEQLPDIVTLPLNDASVWQARVEQITCLRLLNRTDKAQQQLQRWQKSSPPANFASRLAGEELLIELAGNDLDRAMELVYAIQAGNDGGQVVVPETDDAILKTLLLARKSVTTAESHRFTKLAMEQLQHIVATHGPFWKRRAEIRLGRALADHTDTDDPKLLSYAAASQYAAGMSQQAVDTYDRIASLYATQGEIDEQFQAHKTAAAILREFGNAKESLTRFRKLALDHPAHDEAASTHLIAIGLAADLSRDATPKQRDERFEQYVTLLKEHLKQWPDEPSAEKVENWLANTDTPGVERLRVRTLATQGERRQALALYRKLIKSSPDDAALLEAFATLLANGKDNAELSEALRVWQQIEKRSKPGGQRWWRGRRARIALLTQLGEGEQAKKLEQLTKILRPVSLER